MQRLERLYQRLEKEQIDCFVITKPINIFYLLGVEVSVGMLVVRPGSYALYLDSRYTTVAKEKGLHLQDTPLKERFVGIKHIYVEGEHCTFAQFEEMKALYPNAHFSSKMVVEELRMIKEEAEILALHEAGQATARMLKKVHDAVQEGVSEEELEALVTHPSFQPIIAFGSHAAHIHHRPTSRRYKKGENLLIDLGVKKNHYMGDMTRTFHSDLAKRVEEAHDIAVAACRPGVTVRELTELVKAEIPFKDHNLSHGIGLEVHERPLPRIDFDRPLEPNMCISIEPGLYEPGVGGARHENMVLITKTGSQILTHQ